MPALALGEGACRVVGTPCPGHALATAVAEYEASIDGYLEQDEDLAAYVRRLERDGDDLDDDDEVAEEATLDPETDAEQMVEDIERFLRDQGTS